MKASEKLSLLQHATALAAIRSARLRHVGLTPQHDKHTRMVAAVPIDPTLGYPDSLSSEMDYALDTALSYWPDCTDWWIVQADESSPSESIPPDFQILHSPEVCGTFKSAG
jgi:hypothetical protein